MRLRFNIDALAKKLGWTPDQILEVLQAAKKSPQGEAMLVETFKSGDDERRLISLLTLAWLHCDIISQG
jgi:cytochrome c2